MGFLKNFFSGGETVKAVADSTSGIIETVANVIRNEHPELEQELKKAQIELNKIEAAEGGFFNKWRPALAWTCVIGFFYHYLFRPLMLGLFGKDFPPIDVAELQTLLIALLGLGIYRTSEKIKGVQNKH